MLSHSEIKGFRCVWLSDARFDNSEQEKTER